MRLRIITCFLLKLSIAGSNLVQLPEDTEAVVGDDQAVLKCRTDIINSATPIEWHHRVNRDAAFEIVYKRGLILNGYRGRFHVVPNATAGRYDLIITGVKLEDAGAYTCMDKDAQYKAELIVFEKYPSHTDCVANLQPDGFLGSNICGLEPDTVRMSCDLSYRGNLVPFLEWMEGENVIHSNITSEASGLIRSSIERRADQQQTSMYTCRIKYRDSMIISNLTWSSTVNIKSVENTTNLSYGGCELESLDCSDVMNRGCNYTWFSENGIELTSNSAVKLRGNPSGNYTCFATCNIRQTSCSYVAKILSYHCESYSKTTISSGTLILKICITVGIILAVVTTMMICLAFSFQSISRACKVGGCLSKSHDSEAEKGQHSNNTRIHPRDEMISQEALLRSQRTRI